MKKRLLLILCWLLTTTLSFADGPFRNHRYDAFKVLPVNSEQIVFIGNSITNMHEWWEAFGNHNVVNRGVSGAITDEALANIEAIAAGKPKKVFIMLGTNDLGTNGINTTEHVLTNMNLIVERFKQTSPETGIYIQSILPSTSGIRTLDALRDANTALQAMCTEKGATYIDLWDDMMGITSNALSYDYLHLTSDGYKIWCDKIAKYVNDNPEAKSVYGTEEQNNGGLGGANGMRATVFSKLPVNSNDILIIGDEMVNGGEWHELLKSNRIKNRGTSWGYPGASLADMLKMVNAIFNGGGKPAQVFLYAGVGDVNGSTALETVLANYKSVVARIKELSPATKITLMSLQPTSTAATNTGRVAPFNELLAAYAAESNDDNIEYLDIYTDFVNNGVANTAYFNGNYLYGKGYAKVAQKIAAAINEQGITAITDDEANTLYTRFTNRTALGNAIVKAAALPEGNGVGEYTSENLAGVKTAIANAYNALKTTNAADATFNVASLTAATNELLPKINMPATSDANSTSWYQLYTPNRDSRYLTSTGAGAGVIGEAENNFAKSQWKFVTRTDGKLNIINRKDGSYLAPTAAYNNQITTSAEQPANGWELSYSNAPGLFIVHSGNVQLNQTQSSLGYKIYNWSAGQNGTDRGDTGGQYRLVLVTAEPDVEIVNGIERPSDIVAGWYQVKAVAATHADSKNAISAGKNYIHTVNNEYRQNAYNYYPLKYAALDEANPVSSFVYIAPGSNNKFNVQALNGHFLNENATAARAASNAININGSNYSLVFGNWSAYNSGGEEQPYIGKFSGQTVTCNITSVTAETLAKYDIYTVTISDAANASEIGNDPSVTYNGTAAAGGVTKVFNNGYFFFPAGTVPAASDFIVPEGLSMKVNAQAKTLTVSQNTTPPVAYTQVTSLDALTTGWYQIKATTAVNNTTLQGYIDAGTNYVVSAVNEYRQNASSYYPLQYGNNSTVATTFIYLTKSGNNYYLQSLNGHYVNANATASRTVPGSLTGITEGNIANNGQFRLGGWAPYTQYYLGLYSSSQNEYSFYAISNLEKNYDIYRLTIEGVTNASEIGNDIRITCNNAANAALTSVYNNGYFIFQAGTVLAASDFTGGAVEGKGLEVIIDSEAKTITATYFNGYYKALGLAIDEAMATLENTLEGVYPGQFLTADRVTLQAAIDAANTSNSTAGLTDAQVDEAIATLNAAVEVYLAKRQDIAYSTTGNETWYYITSASTKDYCTGKAIVSVSSEDNVAMKFDTKRIDPNMVWCLEKNDAGKVAIRNYATGRYFAANPATGTSATAQYVYTIAKWEGESLNGLGYTIKADGYNPVHAQAAGSVIVNWAAENNGASLWAFETLTDEELNSEASLEQVIIQNGLTTTGIGNEKQPLLRAQFVVEGIKGNATLKGLSGNTGNTTGAVSKLYIYSVTDVYEYRADREDAMLVAETTPASDGSFTFTFENGELLPSGASLYYWLVADISETAKEGAVIDAAITSYNVNDKTVVENAGNPNYNTTVFLTASTVEYLNTYGSRYYRIPGITTAMNGWLVAVTDKRWGSNGDLPNNIDVVARVSKDNGKTWTEPVTIAGTAELGGDYGHGDPAIVTDRVTGDIFVLVTSKEGFFYGTPENPARLKYIVSHDNGMTWEAPVDITDMIYGAGCEDKTRKTWHSMFFSSGAALQTSKGTLMVVAPVRTTSNTTHSLFQAQIIRSDDHGKTWTCNAVPALYDADESKIVELNDGTLLVKSRNQNKGNVYYATSTDDGKTWSARKQFDIKDSACNGDVIRLTSMSKNEGNNRLLLSIPFANDRRNVSVFLSRDETGTWPIRKTVCPGGSAYSSMCVLDDGTIGIYFEEDGLEGGYQMRYVRFSLDWLTDNADRINNEKFNAARVKEAQALAAYLPAYAPTLEFEKGEKKLGYSYTKCTYEVTDEESAALKAAETATDLQVIKKALTNYMDGYSLYTIFCSPEAGKYYRIKAVADWNDDAPYLGAENSTAKAGRAQFVTGADANSIFYFNGDELLSYASGHYLVSNSDFLGYNGVQTAGSKIAFHAASNSLEGAFNISFNNGSRWLYCHQSDYTDAGSRGTQNGYCFNVEEVTSLPVTVTAAGYATLYAPVALEVADGVKAHTVTVDGEWAKLNEITTGVIPANTGVVLEGEGSFDFAITTTDATADSDLRGSAATTYYTEPGTYYALALVDNEVGFYMDKFNNSRFQNNSHKAYLYMPGAQEIAFYSFRFGEDTTGINEVKTENGEVKVIFDLTGRRVSEITSPGIYIVNGKKVIVK